MIKIIEGENNYLVRRKVRNISEDMRRGIRRGFYFSGKKVLRDLSQDILRRPRDGRVYHYRTSSGSRRRHVASIPGEAPANRTGTLRTSAEFRVHGWDELSFGYRAEYGKWVEFGTENMEARPGIKINLEKNRKNIDKFLDSEIKKALN